LIAWRRLDALEHHMKRERTVDSENQDAADRRWQALPAPCDTLEEAHRRELQELVVKVLSDLPSPERTLVWAALVEGRSVASVAREFGVSPRRASTALARGIRRLQGSRLLQSCA
jgi:RNA polymerase sigma factor (sigma-70 family)